MCPEKKPHTGSLDEPIEDPKLIRECMDSLAATQTEFPIKVEGASTLPYTSVVQFIDHPKKRFILKLVRPLPHELLEGAQFRMIFAVDEQRYEGLITFRGRTAYLQYTFDLPSSIRFSDRRRHKRHPFRPREKTYVTAQDGGFPGLGVAGPLANIGLGGCAIRLDRVLRMSDGMRLTPGMAPLDRGKEFAKLRIQDLPKIPFLDLRGHVSHLTDRGDGLVLGFSFGDLGASEQQILGDTLTLREKMFRTSGGPRAESPASGKTASRAAASTETGSTLTPELPADHPDPGPLLLLQRHTARLLVATAPGEIHQDLHALLLRQGYHRISDVDTLESALQALQAAPPLQRPQALIVDLRLGATAEGQEPMAWLREIQQKMAPLPDFPIYALSPDEEPSLALEQGMTIRFGLFSPKDEAAWIAALDDLLELEERESVLGERRDLDQAALGPHPE